MEVVLKNQALCKPSMNRSRAAVCWKSSQHTLTIEQVFAGGLAAQLFFSILALHQPTREGFLKQITSPVLELHNFCKAPEVLVMVSLDYEHLPFQAKGTGTMLGRGHPGLHLVALLWSIATPQGIITSAFKESKYLENPGTRMIIYTLDVDQIRDRSCLFSVENRALKPDID